MALPTIISISEDALYAVPKDYRDAALAVGATQWQTIRRVVFPAARSGLVMSVMLGIGRAIGETMAVMMVTGNAATFRLRTNALPAVRTMTATIAAEMGKCPGVCTRSFGIASCSSPPCDQFRADAWWGNRSRAGEEGGCETCIPKTQVGLIAAALVDSDHTRHCG
jgi:hypothetical protein